MPHPTSSANAEWHRFTTALAEALAELTPYTYLVVARPGIAHVVQFAGEPGGDLRAEAASRSTTSSTTPSTAMATQSPSRPSVWRLAGAPPPRRDWPESSRA